MKKIFVTVALLLATTTLLLGGCGGSKNVDLANGGIKSNSPASADTTASADAPRSDDAFSNDPQFQKNYFDFKPYIKDGKTDDLITATVGSKIHYFMGKDDSPEISIDLSTMVESCAITDEFSLKYKDGEVLARAINVFGFPVELDQCFICSVRITDQSGVYSLAKDMSCGVRTYDEILNYYTDHNLYLKGDDTIIYKNSDKEITYGTNTSPDNKQEEAVFASTKEIDGIFKFDNGILSSISLEVPELLYYELRRNVNQYALEQMSESELSEIEKKRNELLGELKKAFGASSVDVSIDDFTGTISMNSDILFDTDSYEVKDAAKEYIDEFFKIYSSVLMRDDVQSSIESVRFEGHTDTKGDYDYNMTLSLNRAKSVMEYCVNDSTLADSIKNVLGSIAEAEGYSYQYPIYRSDGQVDMDASRRVEVNFVIKTDFTVSEPTENSSSDLTPSTTARGIKANPVYRDVDAAYYNDSSEIMYPGSPVLLVGDKTSLVPRVDKNFDKTTIVFSSSDESVGKVTFEDRSGFRFFYFTAKAPGTTRAEFICPGITEGSDTQFFNIRCFDEGSAKELTLVPDRDTVVTKDQYNPENVKFTLCGDYSGDVWAFVYLSDPDSTVYKADWLDPTTLSIDLLPGTMDAGEHTVNIILTPKDDLDSMLGCLKYKFTVEKE